MKDPTENAVAQVEWAATQIKGIETERDLARVPRAFEAEALRAFWESRWEDAMTWGMQWYADEPISSSPAIFSAFVAGEILERENEAIELLKTASIASPENPIVWNNLAFQHASADELVEAFRTFGRIKLDKLTREQSIAVSATHGLLLFRAGEVEVGRKKYVEAIAAAENRSLLWHRAWASVYLAREEIRVKSSNAPKAFAEAEKYGKSIRDPALDVVVGRLRDAQCSGNWVAG